MAPARSSDRITGKLKAADPFELIRWLARSQPDPRKALAELVQNSLDAGATEVRITRLRERGVTGLHVLDNGEGVIPELPRSEALTYIATHIGHSRKRNLTPEQRRELMLQGQYGIGLLGFWSIGQTMEMRTQVAGEPGWVLRLHEDSPSFAIERMRGRLNLNDRFTEIVIRGLHRPAFLSLNGRRIADYLAAELRGQLLARQVKVLVQDRVARGRAPKLLEVRPVRFEGQQLNLPAEIPVPGFSPIRIELYLLPSSGAEEGRIAVSCGGTVVYEHVEQFELADFKHAPWSERRLNGLIEFPDFHVAPSTRRSVLPDRAAEAFAEALATVEPLIRDQVESAQARSTAELERGMLRQLERAFREVPRLAPQYDFFAARAPGAETMGTTGEREPETEESQVAPLPGAADRTGSEPEPGTAAQNGAEEEQCAELFMGGKLASLQIVPGEARVERFGAKRFRADARDENGFRIRRPLDIRWEIDAPLGRLEPITGTTTTFLAGADTGKANLTATATEGGEPIDARATVHVVDLLDATRTGIPEPSFVEDPSGNWRSRMRGGRWEVNSAHQNFHTAVESPRRKLRYLAALLAKEIVIHSFPAPSLEPILERLVEVLTIADRGFDRV